MSRRTRILVSVATVLAFVRPLLSHLDYQGAGGDILYFHFLWQAGRTTWMRFHELPLWNPYHCGGMVELANPHSMALSPFFIPALVFGADVGLHLFVVVHFIIAFLGMWEWVRARGVPDVWAAWAGVPFAMGGFFAAKSAGHLSFLAFAWTPWILLCLERGRAAWQYAYLGGALVALCVYEGSPYGTTFSIVLVAAWCTIEAFDAWLGARRGKDSRWHTALIVGAVAATAFGTIAAFKLMPIAEVFHRYPRLTAGDDDTLTLVQLAAIFLSRPIAGWRSDYTWAFDEYRNYVGVLVVAVACITLVRRRARATDLAVVVFVLALAAGYHGALSPYALLHRLPPFDSQRVPSRFAILAVPYVGLWFAQGLASIPGTAGTGTRPRAFAAAVVAVAAVVDVWSINATILDHVFQQPPPPPPRSAVTDALPFMQLYDVGVNARSTYLRAAVDGHGYVSCGGLEPNPIPRSPTLRPGPVEQARIEPASAGEAHLARFTPNRLVVDVDVREPARLVINQNAEHGWRSSLGATGTYRGSLAVSVPAGRRTVELWYEPAGLWIYAAITVLGLAGVVLAALRASPGHRRHGSRLRYTPAAPP